MGYSGGYNKGYNRGYSGGYVGGSLFDADAQTYFTAAGITDSTQKSAVNTFVLAAKANNYWSKLQAIFPMVGGSASSHLVNLKSPGTFDVTWNGGITHSSTGALFNGTTGYGDTGFNPSTQIAANGGSLGVYVRTDTSPSTKVEMGCSGVSFTPSFQTITRFSSNVFYPNPNTTTATIESTANLDARGFFLASRTGATTTFGQKNSTQTSFTSRTYDSPNYNVYLGARNEAGTTSKYSDREIAFAFIGDTLTTTDAFNLYLDVQAFNEALGRAVYDADAQTYFTAAGITDATQKSAWNRFVVNAKYKGYYSTLQAAYPMPGTASSNAVNAITPGTYNLTFYGGWTHASTGATPNGTTGYADTGLTPSVTLSTNSQHLSLYLRTNTALGGSVNDMGIYNGTTQYLLLSARGSADTFVGIANTNVGVPTVANTDSRGHFIVTKVSATVANIYKNATKTAGTSGGVPPTIPVFIGAINNYGSAAYFVNREIAFASIGTGLTDQNASDFYTDIQAYQTALGRAI